MFGFSAVPKNCLKPSLTPAKSVSADLGIARNEQRQLDEIGHLVALRFERALDLVRNADGLGLAVAHVLDALHIGHRLLRIDRRGQLPRQMKISMSSLIRTPSRMRAFGLPFDAIDLGPCRSGNESQCGGYRQHRSGESGPAGGVLRRNQAFHEHVATETHVRDAIRQNAYVRIPGPLVT